MRIRCWTTFATGTASGSFVRGDAVELRTGEEADAAAAPLRTVVYQTPGR